MSFGGEVTTITVYKETYQVKKHIFNNTVCENTPYTTGAT